MGLPFRHTSGKELINRNTHVKEELCRDIVALTQHGAYEMHGADFRVFARLKFRHLKYLLKARRNRELTFLKDGTWPARKRRL